MKRMLAVLLLCALLLPMMSALSLLPVGAEDRENLLVGIVGQSNDEGYTYEVDQIGMKFLTDGRKLIHEGTHISSWQSSYLPSAEVDVYIDFALDGTCILNGAALYPRGSDGHFFPEEYDIQVSEDGEEWLTVKTVTGDTSTDIEGREIAFDEVEARFVRVLIRKHFKTPASKGYTTQISELEVIASRTVQPETEPDTEEETTPAGPDAEGPVEPDTPAGADTDIPTEPAESETSEPDTDTPSDSAPDSESDPETEKPKGGCGSAMLSCVAVLGAAGAAALKKKKGH